MIVNKERIKLFVDALRSGYFIQGLGSLCRIDYGGPKHCCLGVACEVASQNGLALEIKTILELSERSYNGATLLPPQTVKYWYGVALEDELFSEGSLAYWNDYGMKSFEDIADMIEEKFLKEEE